MKVQTDTKAGNYWDIRRQGFELGHTADVQ